jgi:hypothetical protein
MRMHAQRHRDLETCMQCGCAYVHVMRMYRPQLYMYMLNMQYVLISCCVRTYICNVNIHPDPLHIPIAMNSIAILYTIKSITTTLLYQCVYDESWLSCSYKSIQLTGGSRDTTNVLFFGKITVSTASFDWNGWRISVYVCT